MGIILGCPGSVLAFSSASGGKVYAYNNINAVPQQVAPINPSRQQLTFHNPGTIDILVAPATVLIAGSFAPLAPTNTQRGGCFLVYANGGSLTVVGECQTAWQAL